MKESILDATREALLAVRGLRFYRTERGFHGRFYCALMESLDHRGFLNEETVLEMEYQKSARHGTHQRPDILLHTPAEVTGALVTHNNYAVWALKRHASIEVAREDFDKLDDMFRTLEYPLGIFINVDARENQIEHYCGSYRERLCGCAVWLDNGTPNVLISCGDKNPDEGG